MAYGYLKGETGIHRLVRISPFNSEGKRQTSFAAIDVSPEVSDNIDIQVDWDKDVREETMRAGGAGGQVPVRRWGETVTRWRSGPYVCRREAVG